MVEQPTPPSNATADYTIGYGRPPLHTRFKPGHTKRGGRPKGQRNPRTALEAIVAEKITIREGKRSRRLTKRDAFYLQITNAAVSGNDKAQSKLITLMQSHGLTREESQQESEREPYTADDEALIADFLKRHGDQAEPTQPPERTDHPETAETKTPSQKSKETKS